MRGFDLDAAMRRVSRRRKRPTLREVRELEMQVYRLERALEHKVTHIITAGYYAHNGTAELSFEDVSTGKEAKLTVKVSKKDGNRLAAVVPACLYSWARARLRRRVPVVKENKAR